MTQKITIEPVTRIEGHAKVTIHLKDDGSVEHAYLHINEFRGFEKFCEGRPYFEMPSITHASVGSAPSVITLLLPKPRMPAGGPASS
jgi:NAD-reducing hydrogenase large subunit